MTLKDSIFLGFCAVIIVLGRGVLRLYLHLPGHTMAISVAMLLLARGSVKHPLAATITGLLAGIMSLVLGMVRGGPLILLHFVLPALAVDLCAALIPGLFSSYLWCALVGAFAGATKFADTLCQDLLAGMQLSVASQHAALGAAPGLAFAVFGSLVVPFLIKRLRARGAIV